MKLNATLRAAVSACALFSASAALADVKMTFVELGPAMQAQIYEPDAKGPKAHVGLVVLHPYSNYMSHSACSNMAERGYTVICSNTPYSNNQYGYETDEKLFPTVRAAVERVKKVSGVDKVVLIGHSMGAPIMAYYQNVAENGPAVCKGPEKIVPCDASLVTGLPKADAIVLLDPHLGEAAATLTYIDPAIADETQPGVRTKDLDLYDAQNGYDPEKRRATYPESFRKKFLAAQAARNAKLIERAQQQLKATGGYADDMPFVVPGGTSARLWQPDTSLFKHTKKEYRLLKADGSQPMQVLTSVRVASGNAKEAVGYGSVLNVSARGFLGSRAIRTLPDYDQKADDFTGVDWASSNTSTLPNMKGVTAPLLIEVMTGHYFLRPGEMVLEAAGSKSKEMVGIEGAAHVITPCVPCGSTPTQFGDTVKRTYDYMDGWLAKQF